MREKKTSKQTTDFAFTSERVFLLLKKPHLISISRLNTTHILRFNSGDTHGSDKQALGSHFPFAMKTCFQTWL